MVHQFNVYSKPNSALCPQNYCFNFNHMTNCCNAVGLCTRVASLGSDALGRALRLFPNEPEYDWYEANVRTLHEHGLPWFYFISLPDSLPVNKREEYINSSEKIWGIEHWKGE